MPPETSTVSGEPSVVADMLPTVPATTEEVNKKSTRTAGKEKRAIEYRTASIRASDSTEGIFEGYAITWDFVDSYNSAFRKGCAKKTLQERSGKIKVLWNHDELIGKLMEAKEDDHGLWVRCRLSLGVQRAQETRAMMLDGTVDTMSFGFDAIKQHNEAGVRIIDEIRLWEVSPVVFAANENTSISNIRATDFTQTYDDDMLEVTGEDLFHALNDTLHDILWMSPDVAMIDKAITDFHAAYVAWAAKAVAAATKDPLDGMLAPNELASSALAAFRTRDPLKVAKDWPLTEVEARQLLMGKTLGIEARTRLVLVSPELATAHAKRRADEVADLFREIRAGGFTHAERIRLAALLGTEQAAPAVSTEPVAKIAQSLRDYVNQLTGTNTNE